MTNKCEHKKMGNTYVKSANDRILQIPIKQPLEMHYQTV